ncbi:MAG: alpha-E domain-containing protein [Alphaproteobacteria bacterium]|nr:alpha-E domain-containing protein [Alphaproteobacteria bacterium]MCY4320200.1 alpha-E domain-containing protein [Alphaproteobacteria bacterium]
MLSRTAESLFWMARYLERAEATAQLVEMGRRMAMLPGAHGREEWRSVAAAAGAGAAFRPDEEIGEAEVCRRLILDEDNPSSIRACFGRARHNARAVRTALTAEMWEGLNDGWRWLGGLEVDSVRQDLPATLDRVRNLSALFRGAALTTMLRGARYDFLSAGAFLERADMTLRLLDAKYFVLLPETGLLLDNRDRYRWISLLHATSALRAYHYVYRGDFSPSNIAHFMILNLDFPCSLAFCYDGLGAALGRLANRYGARHDCHATVEEAARRLKNRGIDDIFDEGLHQFLLAALQLNARLSGELSGAYHF